ncbi:MAG: L-serine ammonia-lyase [Candidatus Bipolaricaulaceae bacterium]
MLASSVLDVLKPAVGPSSSHTFGPLLAARDFAASLEASGGRGGRVQVTLYGSLAHTGRGHLTDAAVSAGLAGWGVAELADRRLRDVFADLVRAEPIAVGAANFWPSRDIIFDTQAAVPHPNTLRFELLAGCGRPVLSTVYASVGGGRVVGGSFGRGSGAEQQAEPMSMDQVLLECERRGQTLVDYVLAGETACFGHSDQEVAAHMQQAWDIMGRAIERGLAREGVLPGSLEVQRRAASLLRRYEARGGVQERLFPDTTLASIYAIAVAEENADGGMVITAPTCGSAGVLPACMRIIQERHRLSDQRICQALVVAGLIGAAAASRASIAGAVVGCQGEIGVASAMAAAAACYLLGGSPRDQVDRAAETALEHFLGLACDPVGGLVQIPCIERNAAGAVSALNAASLALLSGGRDHVSFDDTLDAMREIGRDMPDKYRETSLGGLAALLEFDRDRPPAG